MIRRRRAWLVVAVLFALGNVAGAIMAAVAKEPAHTATHVVLAILAAYIARALTAPPPHPVALEAGTPMAGTSERLSQLELSVGGLAAGVERMSDAQRRITRLFAERSRAPERPDHPEREKHADR